MQIISFNGTTDVEVRDEVEIVIGCTSDEAKAICKALAEVSAMFHANVQNPNTGEHVRITSAMLRDKYGDMAVELSSVSGV